MIEEYKPPEPTWEYEILNALDSLYEDSHLGAQGVMYTTTFANGLIISHMPNGDIC